MYPEAATLKSTRPPGSVDLVPNLKDTGTQEFAVTWTQDRGCDVRCGLAVRNCRGQDCRVPVGLRAAGRLGGVVPPLSRLRWHRTAAGCIRPRQLSDH